jgi:hemoglobin
MLADQPQLQQVLDAGLADAERQPKSWQRAWALRKALDEVRAKLKEGRAGTADQVPTDRVPAVKLPKVEIPPVRVPAPVEPKSKTSLWERLGGQTKIAKMIDDFTTLAAADPKVNFTRNGRIKLNDADVTHFKQEMIDFVSRVTGGPLPYTGKTMKAAHKGMKITSAEFNAAAADLKKVLQDNGVKKTDIDAVLDLVETTRKDIVEVPGGAKAPAGKDDVQKQPATKPGGEPPFEEAKYEGTNSALLDPWGLQDLRGQTVCLTVRAVNPLGDSRRRGVSHEQG